MPISRRLAVIKTLRAKIATDALSVATAVPKPLNETLISEVLPLLEACRFLESNAAQILAPRQPLGHRPAWLWRMSLEIRREPFGTVVVIGPSNYPLLLPAIHSLQALTAGNAVVLKPGSGASPALQSFTGKLYEAGLPEDLCVLTGEDPADIEPWITAGADKIVLTGSSKTGVAVSTALAARVTPAVMELSGEDACIVLADANLDLAASAIRLGKTFNNGNTCIAPRRFFLHRDVMTDLLGRLPADFECASFADEAEAVALANRSEYGLGATVFGSEASAQRVSAQLRCGVVVINDMIVPTADPRLPFSGRGQSGYGVTRGAEGLLEMTTVKAICNTRGTLRPHFQTTKASDAAMFSELIGALHSGSWKQRLRHAFRLIRSASHRASS